MNSNQYQFSHANGTIKTNIVPKLDVPEAVAAKQPASTHPARGPSGRAGRVVYGGRRQGNAARRSTSRAVPGTRQRLAAPRLQQQPRPQQRAAPARSRLVTASSTRNAVADTSAPASAAR